MGKAGRRKKQRQKERREASRHGLGVEAFRAHIAGKARDDSAAYRRRRRDQQSADR